MLMVMERRRHGIWVPPGTPMPRRTISRSSSSRSLRCLISATVARFPERVRYRRGDRVDEEGGERTGDRVGDRVGEGRPFVSFPVDDGEPYTGEFASRSCTGVVGMDELENSDDPAVRELNRDSGAL